MSQYTAADTELTSRLERWLADRRRTLDTGLPPERVADRHHTYPQLLDLVDRLVRHTTGWLYTGPEDDPLDEGFRVAVLDSAAWEIRNILAGALLEESK